MALDGFVVRKTVSGEVQDLGEWDEVLVSLGGVDTIRIRRSTHDPRSILVENPGRGERGSLEVQPHASNVLFIRTAR